MKIVTSLSFQGQCREAFEFYAKVLGGKVTGAVPYGDMPGMPVSDEKYKSWLMHCWLDVGDQSLMGADMDVAWAPNIDKPKNGFDVTLHTEDKAEAQLWFDRLSEGEPGGHGHGGNLVVSGLRLAGRPFRHPVDDQHHSLVRLEAPNLNEVSPITAPTARYRRLGYRRSAPAD